MGTSEFRVIFNGLETMVGEQRTTAIGLWANLLTAAFVLAPSSLGFIM